MVTGPYAFELERSPEDSWLVDGENKLFETNRAVLENIKTLRGMPTQTFTTSRVKNSIFIATDKRFFGLKRDGIIGHNYVPSSLYTLAKKNISTAVAGFFVYDQKFNQKLNDDVQKYIIPQIDDALNEFNSKGFFGKRKQLKNDKYEKMTPDKWHPLSWNVVTKVELRKGGILKNKSGIIFDFDEILAPSYTEYANKILSENPKYLKFLNEIQDAQKMSLQERINAKWISIMHKELGVQLTLDDDENINLLYENILKNLKSDDTGT